MGGLVCLVGAGPGDPGLLTLRGAELLGEDDVIVWDFLASPELLRHAGPKARLIYAGKSGADHTLGQGEINSLLIKEARAGNRVVRLKGGDPYIFGRGGEEAQELFRAGIPFEVVPGVSSTAAAPAYAGIPLTHRGHSSQVVLITGHENPDKPGSSHDWAALAKIGTLAAVMGAGNLPGIARSLIENGKDPGTPAAAIERGSTHRQRTVTAALKDLPEKVAEAGLGAPMLLVVGPVVGLRAELDWFEKKPLFGRRILITRTREQAGRLYRLLRGQGAWVIERPVIKIEKIPPESGLTDALRQVSRYSYVILTSPNGARIFMEGLLAAGLDARALSGAKIAVMVPGTADELNSFGIRADIVPERFVAESLVESFKREKPGPALLARARVARDALPEGLRGMGFAPDLLPLYETLPIGPEPGDREFLDSPPDLCLLTSASTARGLAGIIPAERRREFPCGSIGPITTAEAAGLDFPVAFSSSVSTIPALAEAAVKFLTKA